MECLQTFSIEDLSDDHKKVYDAIIYLVENESYVEIVKKSAMRKYLSEITGIERKKIYQLLKPFQELFERVGQDWKNRDDL